MWIDELNGKEVSSESLPNYLANTVSKEDLLQLLKTKLTKGELMELTYRELESKGINFLYELSFRKEV